MKTICYIKATMFWNGEEYDLGSFSDLTYRDLEKDGNQTKSEYNSFEEFYDHANSFPSLWSKETLFRSKPYVELMHNFYEEAKITSKNFGEKIVIVCSFIPTKSPSINRLMKELKANEFMEWWKDNTSSACPFIKNS